MEDSESCSKSTKSGVPSARDGEQASEVERISSNDSNPAPVMNALYKRNGDHRLLQEMYWTSKQQSWAYMRITGSRYSRSQILGWKPSAWPPPSGEIRTLTVNESIEGLADTKQYEDRLDFLVNSFSIVDPSSREQVPSEGHLYKPLRSGTQIRLLELNSGDIKEPLSFNFHIANLTSTHPVYEAVSYVWGDGSISVEIQDQLPPTVICGQTSVRISKNLNEVLRHLRYVDRSRMIWVDGLCINQDDAEERGHQVSLMGAVYSQARNVLVWLHDLHQDRWSYRCRWYYSTTRDDSRKLTLRQAQDVRGQLLFETVCIIVNTWLAEHNLEPSAKYTVHSRRGQPQQLRQPRLQRDIVRKCLESKYNYICNHGHKWSLWEAIEDLYHLTWFQRTWAVQELVLAQCALAKFGSAEIDWRWVGLAAAILRTNDLDKIQYHSFSGVYNAYLLFRLSNMSDLSPLRLTHLQLMRLTRGLRSTKAHDKVYGLLGITTTDNDPSTGNLLMRPDYRISHTALWQKLACKFINLTNDLSILSSVQHSLVETDLHNSSEKPLLRTLFHSNCPSWVPQWDEVTRASLLPWDSKEEFCASCSIPMVLKSRPECGSLVVEGLRIGHVGCILQGVRKLMRSKPLLEFFTSEQGTKTLYRTLCAGRDSYGCLISTIPHDYMKSLFKVFSWPSIGSNALVPGSYLQTYASDHQINVNSWGEFRFSSQEDENDIQATKYKALVDQLGENRELCLTLNGYLILAPDVVQEGDLLYILAGCSVPVLLRPIEATDHWHLTVQLPKDRRPESKSDRFALVGECYVEGLMFGEAFSDLQKTPTIHGPIPSSLVSEHLLASASQRLAPDVVPWVRKSYGRERDYDEDDGLLKLDTEFIDGLLDRNEAGNCNDPTTQETIAACRTMINYERQLEPKLDWLEIA